MADDGGKPGRVRRIHMAQHLARVVELRPDKPPRMRHRRRIAHHGVVGGRLQNEVVPDALPERVQIGNRPTPQRVVVLKVQAAMLGQPLLVETNLGNKRCGHAFERSRIWQVLIHGMSPRRQELLVP